MERDAIQPCGRCGDPGGKPRRVPLAPARYEAAYFHLSPVCLDCVVLLNEPIAVAVGKLYAATREPLCDLIAEARLGLFKAAGVHDLARGAFSTCAYQWCMQSVRDYLETRSSLIHLPRYLRYQSRLGYTPKPEYVQAADKAKCVRRFADDESDQLRDPRDSEVDAWIDENERRDEAERLNAALAALDARDRTVIARRFGLDGGDSATLTEVGASIGLTRERVRQIEERALHSLRTALGADAALAVSAAKTARSLAGTFRRANA